MKKGEQIRKMIEDGVPYIKISQELNVALSTISYHAKVLNRNKCVFSRRIHDWLAIQEYYDTGHTLKEITVQFSIDYAVLYEAIKRGSLKVAPTNCPKRKQLVKETRIATGRGKNITTAASALIQNSTVSRTVVRKIIMEDNLLPYHCSNTLCPLHGAEALWADKPLVLHLDHKNGIRNDHRIDNLRWLCPNCHSQTETYSGKNIPKLVSNMEPHPGTAPSSPVYKTGASL